jgi:norsolorinic acid ketoreductase
MTSHSTVLITGASRGVYLKVQAHCDSRLTLHSKGIGKGLVAVYLANPNTMVIATSRDTSSANSLHSLPKAPGSRLIVVELDVASAESIKSGITSLTSEHSITSLDVVIANAAIASLTHTKLVEVAIPEIQDYVNVNAYGQLELFRAVLPLLRKSEGKAKFVYISSAGGSLTDMSNIIPVAPYGASKALGNFLFKWLALEMDDVLIWAQHPGSVLAIFSADYMLTLS